MSTSSAESTTVAARLNGQGNGHFSALCGLTTGTSFTGRGASGPSIDQLLAAKIGAKSPFHSVHFCGSSGEQIATPWHLCELASACSCMNTALTSTKRFADEILKTPIEFPTAQEKMSAIV
jgi:hypothetical protein